MGWNQSSGKVKIIIVGGLLALAGKSALLVEDLIDTGGPREVQDMAFSVLPALELSLVSAPSALLLRYTLIFTVRNASRGVNHAT